MKAPFYKMHIGEGADKIEFSDRVESFVYEDCIAEDSYLNINVRPEFTLAMADDKRFVTGKIITFQFGYIGGDVSEVHRARITDIQRKYRDTVMMVVKCLDIGTEVRKNKSAKVWTNKTSADIAGDIAAKYDLELEVDDTKKLWPSVPQGQKSDLALLEYLAAREDGGDHVAYIRNKTLYYVRKGKDRASAVTYTYGDENGTVISFEPTIKESNQSAASTQAVIAHIDPLKGIMDKVAVNNTTEAATGTLGTYKRVYDESGQMLGRYLSAPLVTPTASKSEATALANHKKKKSTDGGMTAKLVTEGNPLLIPNGVITMNNVAKADAGNWHVLKVTHSISGSGYITTQDLSKNGTKKNTGATNAASDKNNTIGPDKKADVVKVRVYDENGIFKGYSTPDRDAKKVK